MRKEAIVKKLFLCLLVVVVFGFSRSSTFAGSIVAWGNDDDGQVSNAPNGTDFIEIAGGGVHGLALKDDGTIISWGIETSGEVSNTPTESGFTAIDSGGFYSLALKEGSSSTNDPDLIVHVDSYTSGTYAPGESFPASGYEQYIGVVFAPPTFYVDAYLSLDRNLDDSDTLLRRFIEDEGLDPGEIYYEFTVLTIPLEAPQGSYYLCLVADPTNAVLEENEGNNEWWSDAADIRIESGLAWDDTKYQILAEGIQLFEAVAAHLGTPLPVPLTIPAAVWPPSSSTPSNVCFR